MIEPVLNLSEENIRDLQKRFACTTPDKMKWHTFDAETKSINCSGCYGVCGLSDFEVIKPQLELSLA